MPCLDLIFNLKIAEGKNMTVPAKYWGKIVALLQK